MGGIFGKKRGKTKFVSDRHERLRRERMDQNSDANEQSKIFTRNRTITGSVSSSIRSVRELTGDLKSSRVQAHHLLARRRRIGWLLVGIVAASAMLVWIMYELTARIMIVANFGDASVYSRTIDDYLKSNPGQRFRPALNVDRLNEYVKAVNPEILNVDMIGAAGLATTQFDVKFREPTASWSIGSRQYYVDEKGVSFEINHFAEPRVRVEDNSGIPQVSGSVLASNRLLKFVGRVVFVADRFGMKVTKAVIPPNTTHQITIELEGQPYPIRLSLDRAVGEQMEDVYNAVTYLSGKGVVPQYIDVRVSGKAYYK